MAVYLKNPPRIKVLEALGSIADERIHLGERGYAKVLSSTGERSYNVWVEPDGINVYSDDNGTRYRKYVGYPIIAILMLQGRLPFNEKIASALRGIPWKKLNEKYKNYRIVENIVKNIAKKKGVDPVEIDLFVKRVLSELEKIRLQLVDKLPEKTIQRGLEKWF